MRLFKKAIRVAFCRCDKIEDAISKAREKKIGLITFSLPDAERLVDMLKAHDKELAVMDATAKAALRGLCEYPSNVIALAYSYAFNVVHSGVDVTEKLETAAQTAMVSNKAWESGYSAALNEIRRRNEQERINEHDDSKPDLHTGSDGRG